MASRNGKVLFNKSNQSFLKPLWRFFKKKDDLNKEKGYVIVYTVCVYESLSCVRLFATP